MRMLLSIGLLFILSCIKNDQSNQMKYLTQCIPNSSPVEFMEHLKVADKLIHRGIFNPDLSEYYFTLSDKAFQQFDVYLIKKLEGEWSEPEKAFFNSDFSEHGMSFSPDGKSLFFSSTRPTNIDSIPATWHIWRSDKVDEKWSDPVFIDIPNLREKLVSHPSITDAGRLYFHASNLDYSEMDIYSTIQSSGQFEAAIKATISSVSPNVQKCTPYVSPKGNYLLFAAIGEQLELMITFKDKNGHWTRPKRLNDDINANGQGNPYVTPDGTFLFYATGKMDAEDWSIKWVNIQNEIK